jgi:hypothetical protein
LAVLVFGLVVRVVLGLAADVAFGAAAAAAAGGADAVAGFRVVVRLAADDAVRRRVAAGLDAVGRFGWSPLSP